MSLYCIDSIASQKKSGEKHIFHATKKFHMANIFGATKTLQGLADLGRRAGFAVVLYELVEVRERDPRAAVLAAPVRSP